MIWVVVWVVLVLGTLVGGFFLGRHVLRSGKALVAELERASEAAERLQEHAAELEATLAAAHPVEPVAVDDPEVARRMRARAAETMAARAARKDARREATFRRWLSLSR